MKWSRSGTSPSSVQSGGAKMSGMKRPTRTATGVGVLAFALLAGCGGQPTVTPAGSAGLEVPYDDPGSSGPAKPNATAAPSVPGSTPLPAIPLPYRDQDDSGRIFSARS